MYKPGILKRLRTLLTRREGFTLAELIISIALLGLLVLVMLQAMLVMKSSVATETGQVTSRTRITRSISFIEQTIRRNEHVGGVHLFQYTPGSTSSEEIFTVGKKGNYLILKIWAEKDAATAQDIYLHYMLNQTATESNLIAFVSTAKYPELAEKNKDEEWVKNNAMVLYRGMKTFSVSITGKADADTVNFGSGSRILYVEYELFHPNQGLSGPTKTGSRNISLLL